MSEKPFNHFETIEAACADRGIDRASIIPQFAENCPQWLKDHLTIEAELLVIASAINQGRLPKIGEKTYAPYFYNSGFGFSLVGDDWAHSDSTVGSRLEFFTWDDCHFFATHYLELHKKNKARIA